MALPLKANDRYGCANRHCEAAPGDVAAGTAEVRFTMEGDIAAVRAECLRAMDPADQVVKRRPPLPVLAYGALRTAQQAGAEFRRNALAMLGPTDEAEARRAYQTEQGRATDRSAPCTPVLVETCRWSVPPRAVLCGARPSSGEGSRGPDRLRPDRIIKSYEPDRAAARPGRGDHGGGTLTRDER